MTTKNWNIVTLIVSFLIINLPSFILSRGVEEINQDVFPKIAASVSIGFLGFVIIGQIKTLTWFRKLYVAGIFIGFLANVILFYLLVKINEAEKEKAKFENCKVIKNISQIKDTSYYILESDIKPDLSKKGVAEKQLKKAMNFYAYYHVFPVDEKKDSIEVFFACVTTNGMMGITLDSYKEILAGGNRYIKLAYEPRFREAVSDFSKKNKMAVKPGYKIYIVTDPERIYGFIKEYYLLSLATFNAIFIILFLLFNLRSMLSEKSNLS
jgi:hypothetical protein